jgi:hypothetical protein
VIGVMRRRQTKCLRPVNVHNLISTLCHFALPPVEV